MTVMKKIKEYFATHFAAYFVLILFIVFSILIFIFGGYLRRIYFDFLLEQNYEEENTLIHYVKDDLNDTIRSLILQGSRTAVDAEIYQTAQHWEQEEISARVNDTLKLNTMLKRNINSGGAIVDAVVSADGIIAQYDRVRTTDGTASMWSGDNYEAVRQMACQMTDEKVPVGERSLPRVKIYTEPSVHPSRSRGVFHIALPLTGGMVSAWDTELLLVSTYSSDILTDVLDSVNIPQSDHVKGFITDQAGNRLYFSHHGETNSDDEKKYRLLTEELDFFGWKLNIEINEEIMWKTVTTVVRRMMIVIMGVLLLVILLILYLFSRMMRPVGLLSASMKKAEKGELNTKVNIEGRHEIWQVAEEYNRMIGILEEKNEEIERQHQTALRSIEQQHDAEWEALESQINAHFICNTLGCINYEAMEAGNHEVSQLLKKLSNILRYTFDQKRQEVMLYQEIAWVDQYLYLQKLRREDLFDYEITFPEVYGHWPCCKLMFQPFVENSIIHGFEGREDGGLIRIMVDMDKDRLRIRIEDNGCGINEPEADRIRQMLGDEQGPGMRLTQEPKYSGAHGSRVPDTGQEPEGSGTSGGRAPGTEQESKNSGASGSDMFDAEGQKETGRTGVGIRNVITRMRMFFGKNFEASLDTEPGKGTCFTFLVPIPEIKEDVDE